jgi:tetratricopeptide (TPR) repeat protein
MMKNWEKKIELSLAFGYFISWREAYSFCQELEGVLNELSDYAKENPKSALPLFKIFIAGCLEKANELDDSGGNLGMFLDDLFLKWTWCCEASEMPKEEYLQNLKHWLTVDEMGYCYDLENTIIPALGERFQKALEKDLASRIKYEEDQFRKESLFKTLKRLYVHSKDLPKLIDFFKKHGGTREDCYHIAQIFFEKNELDEAFFWAEEGLKLPESASSLNDLEDLFRKILIARGQREEAVRHAWLSFEKYPSDYTLRIVFEIALPKEHPALKQKAIEIFEKSTLKPALEGLFHLGEIERLVFHLSKAKDSDLQNELFYMDAVEIASAISEKFPKQAARLYTAQALRILSEKRSKAYPYALDYLQKVKALLESSGESDGWNRLAIEISQEHRRKSAFMPGFKEVVAGEGAPREPNFRERIANKLKRDE